MRAMQVIEHNTPLVLQALEMPQPAQGEVLVRVVTCGLNFGDTLLVKGSYQEKPTLPFTPGMELAGVIEAVGAGVGIYGLGNVLPPIAVLAALLNTQR